MSRAWVLWMCWGAIALLAAFGGGRLSAAELVPAQMTPGPTLDGRLNDWPALPQLLLATKDDWRPAGAAFADYGGTEDISAEVWFAWSTEAFFVALQIKDDKFIRVRSMAEIDRADSVVLSLISHDPPETNEFVVAPLRGAFPVFRSEPASRSGEVRQVNVGISAPRGQENVRRTVYEVLIPWSELSPLRPEAGSQFDLVVSICDADGEGLEGVLERRVTVVLSSTGIVAVRPRPEPPAPAALAPVFAAPEIVQFSRDCLEIGGRDILPLGGETDYSRLPKGSWSDRLGALQAAGMNLVGATVPWAHHQPSPGEVDLSDLSDFLALCGAKGLWVQLQVGPYGGEQWESGGVPQWVLAMPTQEERAAAAERWCSDLLRAVKGYQITAGGAVVGLLVRPLPQQPGPASAQDLGRLLELAGKSDIAVPMLTTNAPAARDNTSQSLANLLDTITFYSSGSPDDLASLVQSLAMEENGPALVAGLVGDASGVAPARRRADLIKTALAHGAKGIVISDFAPGFDPSRALAPGLGVPSGVVSPAGARSAAYPELCLVGSFLRQFGSLLARAVPRPEAVACDDEQVEAVLRSGEKTKFLFLRNRDQKAVHYVRLEVTEPGAQTSVSMPQAGAIGLAPGESKVLLADLPLGRGTLRYSTSEVLTTGRLGERVVLVVYGDPESPGEISLQWPGPPLVTGEVTRQAWDPVTSTLVLDYYHGREDHYLLVDELEIIILSRERAGSAASISGEAGQALLSAGSAISAGELWRDRLEATVDCQAGVSQVSVALPRRPEAVSVDGTPVEFAFETPQRVARFSLDTSSFESEQRASSVWEKARRAVAGGPPGLRLEFDRGWFLPDDEAKPLAWKPKPPNARTLADLGVNTGGFARLRARFDPQGRTRLVMDGATDPVLAFVNGQLVPELSGRAVHREADLRDLLSPGENEIVIVMQSLPGQKGEAAVLAGPCLIPAVSLAGEGTGSDGSLPLERWEVSLGLAGEVSGWTGLGLDVSDWHLIRFGPWRKQGRELAGVTGVGWYRVPFGLPHPGAWRIPYQLEVDLGGPAALYLNGEGLATCPGGGRYVVPLSEALVRGSDENVLAAAVYGVGPETGINRVEIGADREHMTKRRKVEIRF